MSLINNAPPPLGDPIAQPLRKGFKPGEDPQEGQVTQPWGDWLTNIVSNQEKAPGKVASVALIGQTDTVLTTDMAEGKLTTGLYRFSYFMHVTTGDMNGTLELSLFYTSKGTVLGGGFGGMSTDTPSFSQTGGYPLIYIDANTAVNYDILYSPFNGGVVYDFYAILEEISA